LGILNRKKAQARAASGPPDEDECAGCGARSASHPMVGVTHDRESGRSTAFPVCEQCWRDPRHRLVPLKMHFFEASQAAVAVARAGSSNLG
jgi:hypothetical protein